MQERRYLTKYDKYAIIITENIKEDKTEIRGLLWGYNKYMRY